MIAKLATAVLVLFTGLLQQNQQLASPETVYIALGDSVAAGIGSSLPRERSYPALLGELFSAELVTPVRTVNLAKPGESAESFLSGGQLDEFRATVDELSSSDATIQAVTLTLGGNDVLDVREASIAERQQALDSFTEAMPEAIRDIRDAVGPEVPVYVSTIYDPTGDDADTRYSDAWWIAQFNDVIRSATTAEDATLVDLANLLGDEARDLTRYPADVHPTNEGHARIAKEFWRVIGIDTQAPEVVVLSATQFNRYTPTVRFSVSTDAVPDSIQIQIDDEDVIVYPPVEVADSEYVLLVDASVAQPDSLPIKVSVSDLAGNTAEVDLQLDFTVGP